VHKRRGKILAKCLGMYWDKGPCRYLGVPITGNRLKKGDFAGLLARIQGMLGSWCTHTLSIAGRAILIQTILQAMPLYLMTNTGFQLLCWRRLNLSTGSSCGHAPVPNRVYTWWLGRMFVRVVRMVDCGFEG